MPAISGMEELNSARYLYLRKLTEPRDNSLSLVVQEATTIEGAAAGFGLETPELAELFKNSQPIESTKECRSFELFWKHYVAYLVTEEMAGSCGKYDDESFSGDLFREYSKSHFLEHLSRDTGSHTQPVQHYKIICLNHLVDVAACEPPEIRILNQMPSRRLRVQ